MITTLRQEDFELKSFRIDNFGQVDCKYSLEDEEGTNDYHVKVTRLIHSDLECLFEVTLKKVVLLILGTPEESIDQIVVTDDSIFPKGVAFSGKEDNVGVTINGYIKTDIGNVKFSTPKIKYKAGDNRICAELTVFAETLKNEAAEYLFNGKTEETGIFGE